MGGRSGKALPRSGRGGARPGAGRPPLRKRVPVPAEPPPEIPWPLVQQHAGNNADRESIVAALGITAEQLALPENLERLQREIANGRARYRLELWDQLRLFREGRIDRGASVILAAARAEFGGFDEADGTKDAGGAPDQAGAVAEIEQTLGKLRRAAR